MWTPCTGGNHDYPVLWRPCTGLGWWLHLGNSRKPLLKTGQYISYYTLSFRCSAAFIQMAFSEFRWQQWEEVRLHLPAAAQSPFPFRIPHGRFKCFNCVACNFMLTEKVFTHPITSRICKVKGRITCLSTSIVYLPCGLLYVGKTKRQLWTRIFEHKCAIRKNDVNSSVALELVNRLPRRGDVRLASYTERLRIYLILTPASRPFDGKLFHQKLKLK